jgi:hypothetical protein
MRNIHVDIMTPAPIRFVPHLVLRTFKKRYDLGFPPRELKQSWDARILPRFALLAASVAMGFVFLSSALYAAAPQTIVVTSATESALRTAVTAAQSGDTITFAGSLFTGTTPTRIVLDSPLVVSRSLTLVGPGDTPGTRTPWLQLEGRAFQPSPANRILQISGSATTVLIKGIAFHGGAAAGGGAVLIESGATATFERCDFVNNRATGASGGAILNDRGTLILDECLVSLNSAAHGGGIASLGALTIKRSLIERNTATGLGGGVYSSASNLWIESSTLSANRGGTGGAVSFVSDGKTNHNASITAVTALHNVADAQSGGLYVEGSSASARVAGSIFAQNVTVNNGGAQSPHDFATQKSGKINSGDYNIVVKPGTTLSPYGPNDLIGVDPLLGALASNGGRTQTYALSPTSPALNRGNPAFSGVLVQTDQRGFPRAWPAGGRADVGAFEYGPLVTIALLGDATMTVPFGGAFVDPGTTVNGPTGTVVTKTVNGVLNGQVDTCCPGTYDIIYTATSGGVTVSVSRRVFVVESVSLSAPATITRYIELGTGVAAVKLTDIVTMTGLPPAGTCALKFSVAVTPTGYNQTGLASLPTFTLGVIGNYVVAVKAFAQCGVELGSTSFNLVIDPGNVAWPLAIDLDPKLAPSNGKLIGSIHQMIARAGESRWYKFRGVPGSRIEVALTQLPANFDVVVYSDINQVYNELLGLISPASSPSDKILALLGAEFAPEAYSPEAYSPEAYSPEAYSPEAYSPEAYSPEAYSPEAYSPEAYSPEAYSPEAYSPEAYSPEAYSPEAYSPEAYSPEAYASAQQRSLVAFSASPGTVSEGIRFNTYSKSGEFYIRVRGQNGIYAPNANYNLTLAIQQNLCSGVTNLNTASVVTPPVVSGAPVSLILWDSARIAGTDAEKAALVTSLTGFASSANALVVDLNTNALIRTLNAQADANPYCPIAKNLVADATRNLIQAYRKAAPTLADITLVGNDDVIPFFRTDDEALLASESNYFPPVKDATQSQSSLRTAQILTQDRYGSACQVVLSTGPYDLPEAPVGRLVETAGEVSAYLNTYRSLFNGTVGTGGVLPTPRSAFVAGYDFLADAAVAMRTDFAAGLGGGAVINSLITPQDQAPALGWTADQWRTAFLGTRHDISFHAAHFSTGRALAADFTTRFRAKDVTDSATNLAYALILSAGCHSGYNTVDKDAIMLLTEQPDWAQAFARKRAIWISGTGYQYGDTDFVEYTERLLLDLARVLRTGTGPVSLGRALVDAKRRYLSNTTLMRGIHEKTLLQVALYGLPMVKINMPGARLTAPAPSGDIATVVPVASGPGVAHGLRSGALSFTPTLTQVNKTLDVVGSSATIVASYFVGSDGFASIPGEPVRPLESFNVSRPEGLVRGVGFRSGDYTDLNGFVPFTGAPATETRGVHGQFWTEVFYPVRPWNLNQIGEVCGLNGISQLNTFPAQFRSDAQESATGTLRKFSRMEFKLFYCPAVSEAALANPPAINVVSSFASPTAVTFAIDVAASVGAGVQEVWVTYTGRPGSSLHGKWQSFALNAPSNATAGIGTWTGVLPVSAADQSLMLFMVQAANGIGAVAANTNFGRYFVVGTSTLDGIGIVGTPTTVVLDPVPPTGLYRASLPLRARLTTGITPLVGKRIQFRLGPVIKSAITGPDGYASLNLLLYAQPGAYNLEANFAGDSQYQNASSIRPFTVLKMPTQIGFGAGAVVSNSAQVLATLKAQDGTPLKERTVVFVLESGSFKTAMAEITNFAGQARLPGTGLPPGTYAISAYFGKPVTLPDGSTVALSDPLYGDSQTSTSITVIPSLGFHDENAWINYGDNKAPGATSKNAGVSKIEILGEMSTSDPTFGPNSILASSNAPRVSAYLRAELSGKTIVDGSITLQVQANDNTHWRGSAKVNGTQVELNVDWTGSGGLGSYHVWVYPPAGSGPLYNALPAVLKFELTLGTGSGEHPAGGVSEIGTAEKPWTQENGTSRTRN